MSLYNSIISLNKNSDDVEESLMTLELYIEMLKEIIDEFKKRSNFSISDKDEVKNKII